MKKTVVSSEPPAANTYFNLQSDEGFRKLTDKTVKQLVKGRRPSCYRFVVCSTVAHANRQNSRVFR